MERPPLAIRVGALAQTLICAQPPGRSFVRLKSKRSRAGCQGRQEKQRSSRKPQLLRRPRTRTAGARRLNEGDGSMLKAGKQDSDHSGLHVAQHQKEEPDEGRPKLGHKPAY